MMPPLPTEHQLRRGEAAVWGGRPSAPRAKIRRFTPYRNPAGTMLGFFSLETPSGMVINDLKLMIGPRGKRWIGLPSVKQVDKEGQSLLDARGKQLWTRTVEFRDKATGEKFEAIALERGVPRDAPVRRHARPTNSAGRRSSPPGR